MTGWGMTERPYPAIVAGTEAGGVDPQFVGGSGARKMVAEERSSGRWIEQPTSHPLYRGAKPSAQDGQRLTVAEAGVIQSFRADYPWQGERTAGGQQVANAVPPLLGAALLAVVL